MRLTSKTIITAAAVAAGLPESAIMDKPDKETATLPKKRIELSYLQEQYRRTGRPIKKFPTQGSEETHRTIRREVHSVRLPVRVAIHADDEGWLKTYAHAFLAALPKRALDGFGNTVSIKVDKAEYGGFVSKMVEVFKKRTKTFHISFTGMTTSDMEVPLIRDVTLTPNYRETGNGQKEK